MDKKLKEVKDLKNKEHLMRLEKIKKEGFLSVKDLQPFYKESDKQ